MGWRELSVKYNVRAMWLNQLRSWLLVVLVGWVVGWGLVDGALQVGATPQVAVAEVTLMQG